MKKLLKITKTKPTASIFSKEKEQQNINIIKKISFLRTCNFGALTAQEIESRSTLNKKTYKKT